VSEAARRHFAPKRIETLASGKLRRSSHAQAAASREDLAGLFTMARILVADDDSMVGDVVRHTLEPHGHIVGVVGTGADAVRVAETKRPELIILDCSMPGLTGVEALRQIRSSRVAFGTPILMLTARASARDEEIALRAGATDYLRKPFDPAELLVLVERLITKSAASARAAR
jgi:DNA-binding response OmpR family regulator